MRRLVGYRRGGDWADRKKFRAGAVGAIPRQPRPLNPSVSGSEHVLRGLAVESNVNLCGASPGFPGLHKVR